MAFGTIKRRFVGFIALAGFALAPVPALAVKPAMWKVADEDTTIYLFGTIHLLPQGTEWRSPAFDEAAAGSDTLVVETVIDESNPAATVGEMFKLAVSPGLPPIAERVPSEKKPLLDAAIAKSGMPRQLFDRLETWAAAFLLLGVQFKDLGLEPGSGVESTLRRQFEQGGKTIGQLESNAEQLGYFDRLSEQGQRAFLAAVLEDTTAMKAQFGGMLDAWTQGDVEAIAKRFHEDLGSAPELRDALIDQRNINWARWVKSRLDQPGTVMVAVGAGHLAGTMSVVHLLEQQGLTVTRVQ